MRSTHLFALMVPLALAACEPAEPPLRPKWDVDVLPILKGNCFHCHGEIAEKTGGANSRLDMCRWNGVFTPKFTPQGTAIIGARDGVAVWLPFIKPDAAPASAMPPPPALPLNDYEIEVLERWARLPDDEACRKQNPNIAPRFQIRDDPREEDGQIQVVIDVWDPDGDTVFGTVKLGSAMEKVIRASGRHTLSFSGASANDEPQIELFDGWDTTTSD